MENIDENKNIEHKTPNILEYAKSINKNYINDSNKEENNIKENIIKEKIVNNNLNNKDELSSETTTIEENDKMSETNDTTYNDEEFNYFNVPANEYNYYKKYCLCKFHNEKFKAYCLDCNQNVCYHCKEHTEMHKNHNVTNFNKLKLNKYQEEELKNRLYLSYIFLRKLKQIILDICSNLIDLNEIILKNKVKKAFIKYYKQNLYQFVFSKLVFFRYINLKEKSLLNYQALVNLYQIKFNNIKFPDSNIEIKERAKIMIDFLGKTENYCLLSSDSPHPYINYNTALIRELRNSLLNKNKSDSNKTKKSNNNKKIPKATTTETETVHKENKTPKKASNDNNNKDNKNKEKSISYTINQTKITTTTSIIIRNSSLRIENDDDSMEKKNEKIRKTKNYINSKERLYKEIGEQRSYEYLTFIEENPPLNDGIEVQFRKEIKFIYNDKIRNKIIFSIYQGECQKGTQIRHGRGFFKWNDGEKYIGYWVNDKREGKGINCYKNGNVYEGMFKNGKKEGKGRYEWKNGDIYEGEWKNGVKEGEGIYYSANGDIYKGYFLNDKINGKGIYTWKNQEQYKGEFKNNCIQGLGILYKNSNANENDNEGIKIYTTERRIKIFK